MLENLPGLEVEEFFVAGVLQHQCLLAVADDDPIALTNLQFEHEILPPRLCPQLAARRRPRLDQDQTPEGPIKLLSEPVGWVEFFTRPNTLPGIVWAGEGDIV